MTFDRLMQNNMPITGMWSRLKPEEEFQYGGRLFFAKSEIVIHVSHPHIDLS